MALGESASYDRSIECLARLQGSDQGLLVLAVHSFVEGGLKDLELIEEHEGIAFRVYVQAFKDRLDGEAGGRSVRNLRSMARLHNPRRVSDLHGPGEGFEEVLASRCSSRMVTCAAAVEMATVHRPVDSWLNVPELGKAVRLT